MGLEPTFGDWLTIATTVGASVSAAIIGIWSLSNWLAKQFAAVRMQMSDSVESIKESFSEKMREHQASDDAHFSTINDSMWEMRIREAARFGLNEQKESVFDRENQSATRAVRRTFIKKTDS